MAEIIIPKYENVTYNLFQDKLAAAVAASGKNYFNLADELKVKSVSTVMNALQKDVQKVSDSVLTNLMAAVKFNGVIVWAAGERKYFVAK